VHTGLNYNHLFDSAFFNAEFGLNVKDAYNRTVFEHEYDLQTPAKEGESIPPLKTTHINNGTSTVVFDCTGKPVETRDAKGALTLHAYDVLQRPIKMWCKDNNDQTTTLRQNSEYGTNSSQNNNGKIVAHFDESGYEIIDTYDFKGNVLQKTKQVINNNEILNAIQNSQNNGWNNIVGYSVDWTGLNMATLSNTLYQTNMEYDGLNRLKKITYPTDAENHRKELIPLYNKAGALQKVQFDGTEYVKEIAYNAKGQRLLIAYGNGLMTRYAYNEQTFRLTRLKTEGYTYSQSGNEHGYNYNAGTVKQDFAYTYDKGGNIVSINDVTPACGIGASNQLQRDFEYDALYRLLNATGRENQASIDFPQWDDTSRSDDPNNTQHYTQTYSYDLMGNINQLQHQGTNYFTRSFNYGNNLLHSIAVSGNNYTFEYDVCGNQTKENQERNFNWDYANNMKLYYNQVNPGQEPSVYSHYLYDSGGNRVKKFTHTQGGNWETITYIDGIIEYREDNNGQTQSITHIMDDSKRIASIRKGHKFGETTPDIKYNMDSLSRQSGNHLGSSNLSVDTNGTLVNREEYYPFGETSFGSYAKKRYRFCGKEKDKESGMYYYGARYYSPWTCRFISVDPKAGKYVFQSPFAYADNNPICKMDYNGEGTGEGGGEQPPSKPSSSSAPVVPIEAINGLKKQFAEFVEKQKTENAKPIKQKLAEAANNKLVKNNIKPDNTSQVKDKLEKDVKTKQVVPAPKQATLSAEDPYEHLNSFERGMIVNNPVTTVVAVAGAIVTTSVVAGSVAAIGVPLLGGTPIERFSNAGADVVSQFQMLSMQDSMKNYNFTSTIAAFGLPREPYISSLIGNSFPVSPSDVFENKVFINSILGDLKLSDVATKTIIGGTANLLGDKLKLGDDLFGQFSSNLFGNQFENIFTLLKNQKNKQDSILRK